MPILTAFPFALGSSEAGGSDWTAEVCDGCLLERVYLPVGAAELAAERLASIISVRCAWRLFPGEMNAIVEQATTRAALGHGPWADVDG